VGAVSCGSSTPIVGGNKQFVWKYI
jgi:hypothetical protein